MWAPTGTLILTLHGQLEHKNNNKAILGLQFNQCCHIISIISQLLLHHKLDDYHLTFIYIPNSWLVLKVCIILHKHNKTFISRIKGVAMAIVWQPFYLETYPACSVIMRLKIYAVEYIW